MSPSRSLPPGSRMHSHPYSWNESLNPSSLLSRFTDDEIEGKVGGVFRLRWDSSQVAEASQDPCPEECLWVQDGAGGSPHLSQRGFASGTAAEKRTLQTTRHSEVKPSPRAPSAAPRRAEGRAQGEADLGWEHCTALQGTCSWIPESGRERGLGSRASSAAGCLPSSLSRGVLDVSGGRPHSLKGCYAVRLPARLSNGHMRRCCR